MKSNNVSYHKFQLYFNYNNECPQKDNHPQTMYLVEKAIFLNTLSLFFHLVTLFAGCKAKTRIRQHDWLTLVRKKLVANK